MGLFSNKETKKHDQKYFIYIKFGWYQEADDYDLEAMGLDNLTKEQALKKLDEIKHKVEARIVEFAPSRERLINWGVLQDCYINKL